MKSSLTKAIAIAVLASGFASQAYAEHPTNNDGKRVEASEAYWKTHPQSGGTHADATRSQMAVTPEQRLAKSNMEYFAANGNTGGAAAVTQNSDYEFNTQPSQRTAKRNYDYFKK